jgi:hypothetical protein
MSLDDTAVLIAKIGHIYKAPVNTVRPVSPTNPGGPWVEIGHSSADSPFKVTRSGGDVTVKRSWQSPALRSDVADVVYALEYALLQQDETAFQLYFGGGAVGGAGDFVVPLAPTAQEHALFVRLIDGANELYRWFPKVATIGSDSIEDATDDFTNLPVTSTILTPDGGTLAGLFALQV